jgi:hypothetical protein
LCFILLKYILKLYGTDFLNNFRILHSDNGGEFVNELVQSISEVFHFECAHGKAYNPREQVIKEKVFEVLELFWIFLQLILTFREKLRNLMELSLQLLVSLCLKGKVNVGLICSTKLYFLTEWQRESLDKLHFKYSSSDHLILCTIILV